MAETDDVGKEQKLESARRFCDLMEEEEDISIAQVNFPIFISAINSCKRNNFDFVIVFWMHI